MLNFIKNLISRNGIMVDSREDARIKYAKLQRRGDIEHELELQRRRIESLGDRVLNIINNGDDILLIFRRVCADNEADDSAVYLRTIIITPMGVRYPELRLDAVYYKEEAKIKIGDIKISGQNINCGYGSIMMKELLKIADRQKVRQITGWISGVDWNHIERLQHFYEKHGFKVILDLEKKSGDIVLEM